MSFASTIRDLMTKHGGKAKFVISAVLGNFLPGIANLFEAIESGQKHTQDEWEKRIEEQVKANTLALDRLSTRLEYIVETLIRQQGDKLEELTEKVNKLLREQRYDPMAQQNQQLDSFLTSLERQIRPDRTNLIGCLAASIVAIFASVVVGVFWHRHQGSQSTQPRASSEQVGFNKSSTKTDMRKVPGQLTKAKAEILDRENAEELANAEKRGKEKKQKNEQSAKLILSLAKQLISEGNTERAREFLSRIISDYPDSSSSKEARELLKTVKD